MLWLSCEFLKRRISRRWASTGALHVLVSGGDGISVVPRRKKGPRRVLDPFNCRIAAQGRCAPALSIAVAGECTACGAGRERLAGAQVFSARKAGATCGYRLTNCAHTGESVAALRGTGMLRKLGLENMDRAATVYRASFDHALPTLAALHTAEEDRRFFRK